MVCTFCMTFLHFSIKSCFSQLSGCKNSTHLGSRKLSLVIGKSASSCSMIRNTSSLSIVLQFTAITVFPYCASSRFVNCIVSCESGRLVFTRIKKGFPAFSHSITVFCSASSKFTAGISPKEPSVVIINPRLECSLITLLVPISAAFEKGISSSDHGVFTMRSFSSSMAPTASGTKYPTQSISLIFPVS